MNRPKGKLCHYTIGLDVRLFQNGKDSFTVQYGKQIESDLTYSKAATQYGEALMHALACNGLLDNREKGEQ